jgi:tryptophan 6-halogenase
MPGKTLIMADGGQADPAARRLHMPARLAVKGEGVHAARECRRDFRMDNRIKDIVILGGGSAGWMSACYLSTYLQGSVRITVLEAPAIPKIGVGEATIPNLQRVFFDQLGLDEDEWMPECNASFKMGIKYINWRSGGSAAASPRNINGRTDYFYHLFGLLPEHDQFPLSHYWLLKRRASLTDQEFDYACFKEPPILDANLAPRWLDGRRATSYAWHFDAHLVADYLRRIATKRLGIQHVEAEMQEVLLDEHGLITALRTKDGRTLAGDFFVDCSGFRGLLINKVMGEPFIDMSNYLLCDSAVAASIPHDDEKHGVEPFTSAIAMNSGWTWRIPMLGRFGSGYVYSSQFAKQDEATEDFCKLWGLDPTQAELNQIRFRVGRNRRAWVKNCVGIGLSSCFLEPLESTGLYFIYGALYHLAKHFPDKQFNPALSDGFNREIETMFDDSRDFIQIHYYFSPRVDTAFWKANKELHLSDSIMAKIELYRAGMPINQPVTDVGTYYGNFEAEFRNFWTNGSYFCILAGLGLVPEYPPPALTYRDESIQTAEGIFLKVKEQQRELLRSLPTNYQFLRQVHGG